MLIVSGLPYLAKMVEIFFYALEILRALYLSHELFNFLPVFLFHVFLHSVQTYHISRGSFYMHHTLRQTQYPQRSCFHLTTLSTWVSLSFFHKASIITSVASSSLYMCSFEMDLQDASNSVFPDHRPKAFLKYICKLV